MNANGRPAVPLPVAARPRWQPLRAGLVDLYHYDREEFWFRDGHLLLRGNNGTGKSKVLALTLPFLLDGDLSANRVEPDGDPKKRMGWNLLLGGSRSDRLGYTWLEFGRRDADGTQRCFTIGCGLRATAGREKVDTWFFTTDLRVGEELFLVSPGGVARNRQRLAEALGDRGTVYETAERYRRALDERLFGLGEERYATLVDLLIQLRQPQLSRRPDEAALDAALTRALPPLDPQVVSEVAQAFLGLETERDELSALAEARTAADRFLGHYRRYAAIASRRKAEGTRRAQSRYEHTGRRLADARRALADAEAAEAALAARIEGLELELDAARAAERALSDSPEARDARELERARLDAERAASAARRAGDDLEQARRLLAAAQAEADRAQRTADAAAAQVQTAEVEAQHAAQTCGLGAPHAEAVRGLAHADPDLDALPTAEAAVRQAAERREGAAQHVLRLARTAEDAARTLAAERRRRDEAAGDRDAAAERLADAERRAEQAGAELVAAFAGYLAGLREFGVPDRDALIDALADWVPVPDGANPAMEAVAVAAASAGEALAKADERLALAVAELRTERATLLEERRRLEAGEDLVPPSPHTRTPGVRDGRAGAPLWRLVEFADGVGAGERAGLEAALESSGLLDAWVTPDGALLDPSTFDVVVTAAAPAVRHLGLALRPAVDRGDPAAAAVPDTAVEQVLAGIGLGAATAQSWVEPTGRWRLGVAEGAWGKPAAVYLGRGARDAARRARLAELAAALADLGSRITAHESERQRLAARRRAVDAEAARVPSDAAVRQSAVLFAAALDERARLDSRLDAAERTVSSADDAFQAAMTERDEAASDLRVPAGVADLERLIGELAMYRGRVAAVWPAVRGAAASSDALRHARRQVADAREGTDRWKGRDRDARRAVAETEASHATLADTVGAGVAELQRRLEENARLRSRLQAELRGGREQQRDLDRQVGAAATLVSELDAQLAEATDRRVDAAVDFQRFAATGLLTTALPELDLPPLDTDWAPDPTVRLTRRVEAELAGVDMDDAAWERNQRGIAGHLSELTDVLSRYGHTVAGQHTDDGVVVTVEFHNRPRPPVELARLLADEVGERERILQAREREILENHLVNEVASYLRDLLADADEQVRTMNAELEERPTSTGMRLRFVWEPSPSAPAGLTEARRRLLRQTVDAWSEEDRRAVEAFLHAQIQAVRAADEGGTWLEHLTTALDYRAWHRFRVQRWQDGAWRTATGPASGGERVLAATVPLFAAASAHYRSAGNPQAPRLVLLDEAFAGVDDDSRAQCMGLLATFDLDFVMTSEREWGCYAELPGLAIAHLARRQGIEAVHVTRWEWDGRARVRADHPLPPLAEPEHRPSGDGDGSPSLW